MHYPVLITAPLASPHSHPPSDAAAGPRSGSLGANSDHSRPEPHLWRLAFYLLTSSSMPPSSLGDRGQRARTSHPVHQGTKRTTPKRARSPTTPSTSRVRGRIPAARWVTEHVRHLPRDRGGRKNEHGVRGREADMPVPFRRWGVGMESGANGDSIESLDFGHQLAEGCPSQLGSVYLEFSDPVVLDLRSRYRPSHGRRTSQSMAVYNAAYLEFGRHQKPHSTPCAFGSRKAGNPTCHWSRTLVSNGREWQQARRWIGSDGDETRTGDFQPFGE
ncbi:hypothetical protein HO173_002410 [Letharia columbiana]|uniref:Uncharacterized protein n=1 Tax=Letharia columbiana TaxID=112416 RepID=A0A8H6G3G4_9LECA|nr:uncharacterized protein HO173_002410 [Letharia columbiana]KAF6239863.1 hypothetical protein HO173_002410 [Letharia columbiana]